MWSSLANAQGRDSPQPGTSLGISSRLPALVTSQLLVALTGLVITRFVTPEVKGQFTACLAWTSAAFMVSSLSVPAAVVMRSVGGTPAVLSARSQRAVLLCNLMSGSATAALLWYSAAVRGLAAVVLVAVLPPLMFWYEYSSQLSLLERSHLYSVIRLAQAAFFMVSEILVAACTSSTSAMLAALLASYLVSYPLRRYLSDRVPNAPFVRHLRWARSAHPGILLATLGNRADFLVVVLTFSSQRAGIYAAAAAFPSFLAFVSQGIGTVLGPSLRSPATRRRAMRRGLLLVTATSAVPAVVCVAIPRLLIRLAYGSSYLPAAGLLAAMGAAAVLWNLAVFQGQALALFDRPGAQSIAQTIALGLLLGVSILAAVFQDLRVAAFGSIIAYGTAAGYQAVTLRRIGRT